jgi:acyl-CoA synthetase (AMP-forming)/AMP-acid ligase II
VTSSYTASAGEQASEPGGEPKQTVGELLKSAARAFGDQDYVVSGTGRLSYAEAEARSGAIAARLLAEGVGKGTRVGLFFTGGTDWVLWWLAAARIGALTAPLSTFYAPAELARVLRLADVDTLIAPPAILKTETAARLEAALPGLAESGLTGPGLTGPGLTGPGLTGPGLTGGSRLRLPAAPYLRRIVITGPCDRAWATHWDIDEDCGDAELLAAVEQEVSAADLAVIVHTSGSTAEPKGVLHTHGTLVRQTSGWVGAVRHVTGASGAPRVLCAMPFFWIGGILGALGALHEPLALLVLPRLEAGAALDLLERERGNGVIGWPTFTEQLRAHPTFAGRDLSSAPMLSGGPADLSLVGSPDGVPSHRSMSETGGSFAFTDIRIAGADGREVPAGEVGELWVRGVGSMAGYNKRERAEVFDADGWFHSGDRVYRRDGDPRLFYMGRTTDMIKSAGSNISPLEVQAVIEGLESVAQCVVLGVADPARGEAVCAVIVPTADGGLDLARLRAVAAEQLSAYKVPTRWIVTSPDELPVLATGKPDRRSLRDRIEQGEFGASA